MARYCVRTLLARQDLWPTFENDTALAAFWALQPEERKAKWGQPLDLSAVSASFKAERVPDPEPA